MLSATFCHATGILPQIPIIMFPACFASPYFRIKYGEGIWGGEQMSVSCNRSNCPPRLSRQRINSIMRNPLISFPACSFPVAGTVSPFCPPFPCPTVCPPFVSPTVCPVPVQIAPCQCPPVNIQIFNNIPAVPVQVQPTVSPTQVAGVTETVIPVTISPVSGVISTNIIQGPSGRPSLKTLNNIMRNPLPQPCRCIPPGTNTRCPGTVNTA
jgi:hypothetical protein